MTLAIYCAGGLGREVIELARAINRWERIIFVDDITEETVVADAPVYRFAKIADLSEELEFIIASGEPAARENLYAKIKGASYPMATLISPWAYVGPRTEIGEGCVIYDGTISCDVKVDNNTWMGAKCMVGHDAEISQHAFISANCFIGGWSVIEEKVYMAAGSMVKDRLRVGSGSIISLGAVVLRNVRANSVMIGNPAKRISQNTEEKVFGMFS